MRQTEIGVNNRRFDDSPNNIENNNDQKCGDECIRDQHIKD